MATQDITFDCTGWRLKREVTTELALTPTLKFSLASHLGGERRGAAMPSLSHGPDPEWPERETHGEVQRLDGETRVEIVTPDDRSSCTCRADPDADRAVGQVVDRLGAGAARSLS